MSGPTDTNGAAHRLAVLGAGVMGVGIATLAVGRGLPVVLVDVDGEAARRAGDAVPTRLRLAQMMGQLPRDVTAGGLTTTTTVGDIDGCTAVVEAVTERAELKADVISEVSAAVPPGTPLISNTSAVPIDEQADAARRPEDVVGVHFMNPPYLVRTAELIRGPRTAEATVRRTAALLDALGQRGIPVGDGPGFVINRILQRMINEAARIAEEGLAAPEDVDALFQGCLGHSTGPLATADLIGLDNVVDSLWVLRERTGDHGYEPCDALLRRVKAGDLGRKSGRGFFDYGGTQTRA